MSLLIELRPEFGRALVVGGGLIAARKVRTLLDAGFAVTVVSPERGPELQALDGYDWEQRPFAAGDTQPFALVLACTDDRAVNRAIGEEARAAGKPVLVADAQAESTFFSPAMHRDGGLAIAVSTGGASPSLAREVRDRIAECLGGGWAETVAAARHERETRQAEAAWEDA